MRRLLALSLFLALLGCAAPRRAVGQFIGYTAQQTTIQTLTIAAGAPTANVTTPINNLGQAAHSLFVSYGAASANCTVWLQGSPDGVGWSLIASAPNISGGNEPLTAFAVGYYAALRVVANGNRTVGCTTSIKWTYIGYQFPPGFPLAIYNKRHVDIAAAVLVVSSIEYPDPIIVQGFSCFNPNASVAYLQLGDSATPPATLGTSILYEIGIPAGVTVTDNQPIFSGFGLSAGAATAAGGGTPVATPLVCDFQVNMNGPFAPRIAIPNSP